MAQCYCQDCDLLLYDDGKVDNVEFYRCGKCSQARAGRMLEFVRTQLPPISAGGAMPPALTNKETQ